MKQETNLIQNGSQMAGKGGCAMYLNLSINDEGLLVLSFRAAIKKDGLTQAEVEVLKNNSDIIAHMLELFMKDRGAISDGGVIEEKPILEVTENPIAFSEGIINKLKHTPLDWNQVRRLLCLKLSGIRFRTLGNDELEELNRE